MSIEKEDGMYRLYCDICGEKTSESFFDFYDAVQHKKQEGWRSQKNQGEWEDVCPDCQEAELKADFE
ncbi:MAG TPA: hypothetical protein GX745_08005 [Clostridiales bacterium]|nr:hypothetical protein [Clostridiales bacterium]